MAPLEPGGGSVRPFPRACSFLVPERLFFVGAHEAFRVRVAFRVGGVGEGQRGAITVVIAHQHHSLIFHAPGKPSDHSDVQRGEPLLCGTSQAGNVVEDLLGIPLEH